MLRADEYNYKVTYYYHSQKKHLSTGVCSDVAKGEWVNFETEREREFAFSYNL